MCAVSFWGLQPQRRRPYMFLQSNDAVVPDNHATVGHHESMSDGPLSFRLFILLSLSVAPYSILPSVIFMLTVYGVFRRLITYSFDLGGKIIKWAASSRRAFNAFGHVVPPYWQHP